MPTDNLTARVRQELERRGKIVSDSQIEQILKDNEITTSSRNVGIPFSAGPISTKDKQESKGTILNAVGAGLWSALDVAAFGVPGAFVEEEKFIDFEDPIAKWTSAIGGFAGFVAGAPLKVGAKGVQLVAKPFIKKAGRKSVDTVVRGMKQVGKDGGLSRKAVKDITKGYKNIVAKSQIDPTLRGKQFQETASKFMNRYIDQEIRLGNITSQQAKAVQSMFTKDVMRRPMQDFLGLMVERGAIAGATGMGARSYKVMGKLLNESLMFGMIDTVFEGVSVIEDGHYDFTAPLWGGITGVMFSQLGWLSPKGKGSSWLKDFKDGIRSSFSKSPYAGYGSEKLAATARFMGESSEHYGKSAFRDVSFKGQSGRVNLKSDNVYDEFKTIFGNNTDDALKTFLDSERKVWGREIMKWSTKESFENLQSNWFRMTLGGLLFNAHTFYDMYAHDYEADVSDILPHFLIGAYVQRRGNPAKFDLNAKRMNQIRQNLMILGQSPSQLSEIPSFAYSKNRFDNPFNSPKYKSVSELSSELGIISNNFELTEVSLAEGEVSMVMKNTANTRIFNDFIYDWLVQTKRYAKPKDSISITEVDRVVNEFKKIDSNLKTYKDFEVSFDETAIRNTKDFEREFTDIIEQVKHAGGDAELGITLDLSSSKDSQVPKTVNITKALITKARNGELDFLVDKSTGDVLKGDSAEAEIRDKVDGLNKVLTTAVLLNKTKNMPKAVDVKSIESESLLKSVHDIITNAESRINSEFPDNTTYSDKFTFNNNFNDYISVLTRNYALRSAEKVYEIFKPENAERDKLSGLLNRSGIIHTVEGESVGRIRSDTLNIQITGTEDAERIGKAKRFLNRVLTIQAVAGGYNEVKDAPNATVKIGEIDALNKFLTKRSFDVMEVKDWMHSQLVDYIIKDKIKYTDLQINQVDAIMNLSEISMGGFEPSVKGKASGFKLKLVDENLVPVGYAEEAAKYNEFVRQAVNDGKGLVRIEGDPVKVIDSNFINSLITSISSNESIMPARAKLVEFMSLLPTEKEAYSTFQKNLSSFIAEPGNINMAVRWLNVAGVIKSEGKGRKDFKIDMDAFNEELAIKLNGRFDRMGITQKYAERRYVELEQGAKDRLIQDTDESTYDRNIDLDTFYKRYRIDGDDVSSLTSDARIAKFQELVYTSVENRLLTPDVVNKVFDRIYVESNGEYIKYTELGNEERSRRKPKILSDIVGLLSTQRAQVKLDVIKYKNGNIVKETEIAQVTRFRQLLIDGLDIPYYVVDTMAPIYEMVDGRYVRMRYVDMFRSSPLLSTYARESIDAHRKEFVRLLSPKAELFGDSIKGEDGELGVSIMRLSPNMDTLAIETRHLHKLKKPFKKLANKYGEMESISPSSRKIINELVKLIDSDAVITTQQYEQMLRRITFEKMLTGSDGNRSFIDWMNGENTEKTMGRIKLFNTKKFVRNDKDFLLDVADSYGSIGDRNTERVLRKILRNDGFGVTIWNDEGYSTVRAEVEKQVKDAGLQSKWSWDNVIGEAHNEVSAFDSISFVSRDMMRYLHAVIGHNPNSINPIKPIISSGGKNSPLLLGKTLFIYSDSLNGFFQQNPNVDIMMTKSGAKAMNPLGKAGELDASIINKPWERLTGSARAGQKVGEGKVRKISIDSLGILPSKDADIVTAKESVSDHNYRNNKESGKAFESDYKDILDRNLDSMDYFADDPIAMREFVLKEMGNEFLTSDLASGEGLNHLSNLFFYSNLSKEANPMSYSERVVKNKVYGMYVNSLVNNKRSVTNQFSPKTSYATGGQSILIQAPSKELRLKSTLVDNSGKMIQRGELLLPDWVKDINVTDLISSGFEIKFVRGANEVLSVKDMASEIVDSMNIKNAKEKSRVLVDTIEYLNTTTVENLHEIAQIRESQIGAIAIRNPRTRPNDMALLGVKGFLGKNYGNSLALNSLDVVNVFEGDYDVDKANFFFASKQHTFDHVIRASQFYVQGVDPSRLKSTSNFHMGMNASLESKAVDEMAANNDIYKSSIGIVQKVPRMLGFLSKLGSQSANPSTDPYLKDSIRILSDGTEYAPKTLLSGENFRITIDYENIDFFTRSALETQYIIDGSGKLNADISSDITSWRNDFLFPRLADSVAPGEASKKGIGFINDMRSQGHSDGKRVRIFRKFERTPEGDIKETELSNLEQAMIKEMLSEYGSFLNATGKSLFENTGEQRAPKYDDVMSASEKFFNFNRNISDNLYYRLRRKRIDITDPNSKKWYSDESFKRMFQVVEKSYKDNFGNEKKYWKPTNKVIDDIMARNGMEFYEGKRGAVIDRVMQRLYDRDPFSDTRTKGIVGESRLLMDEWYAQLHGQTGDDWSSSIDRFTNDIKRLALGNNHKIRLIGSLYSKITQIKNNYKVPYKIRSSSVEKLDKLVSKLEEELKPLINKAYWKTHSTKDLNESRFNFVVVDKESVRKGVIQYATMDNLKHLLPLIEGDVNFGLSASGIADLKEIKQLRRLFYSNNTKLGDVIEYGDKSLITSKMQEFLSRFPTMSTFYEIETEYLKRGVSNHGIKFMYAFMQPVVSKYDIGVFEGRPVSVPYQETGRYSRGIQFMTHMATNRMPGLEGATESNIAAKKTLMYLQLIESQLNRFYNRKFDLKNIVGKNIGEFLDVSQIGEPAKMLIMDNIRLPDFHSDVQSTFGGFKNIEWSRNNNRISNGFGLTNDYLLDFYTDLMKLAGKEKDFESYLHTMNDIQNQMSSNNTIDPMEYMAKRSMIESEVKNIMQDVLTSGIIEDKANPIVRNIINNPVYAIMGGRGYFKGLAFEKQSKLSIDRLREMKTMHDNLETSSNEANVKNQRARKIMDEVLSCRG